MKIYPVIHFLDRQTALEQVRVAQTVGASGVFLISHLGDDVELVQVAAEAKRESEYSQSDFSIGINLLSQQPLFAAQAALKHGLDMVWADDMGVSSEGLTDVGRALSVFAVSNPQIALFASIAFKYQKTEGDPPRAAKHALDAGFIPTTSGSATGSAPDVIKIAGMSVATSGELAVASGMTPENVADFAPYLSHILVATGISLDAYRMDPAKLEKLLAAVAAFSLE